jgi:hypothetical protein
MPGLVFYHVRTSANSRPINSSYLRVAAPAYVRTCGCSNVVDGSPAAGEHAVLGLGCLRAGRQARGQPGLSIDLGVICYSLEGSYICYIDGDGACTLCRQETDRWTKTVWSTTTPHNQASLASCESMSWWWCMLHSPGAGGSGAHAGRRPLAVVMAGESVG